MCVSSKSTFLKALSGRLSHDSSLKGTVRFNNLTDKENLDRGVHVSRLAAFVGQSDMLFPVLTVDETLRFAANSSLPDPRLLLSDPSLSPEDRVLVEELIAADPQRTDMLIKLLGLEECKQTIVGNDLLRGVSGGQVRDKNHTNPPQATQTRGRASTHISPAWFAFVA